MLPLSLQVGGDGQCPWLEPTDPTGWSWAGNKGREIFIKADLEPREEKLIRQDHSALVKMPPRRAGPLCIN